MSKPYEKFYVAVDVKSKNTSLSRNSSQHFMGLHSLKVIRVSFWSQPTTCPSQNSICNEIESKFKRKMTKKWAKTLSKVEK